MTEDEALEEIVTTFYLVTQREITTKDEITARLRATLHAMATAQRERDAQTVSTLHCPECRAGQTPAYDEYWRAYYHGTLLCLGSTARRAIRNQS